MPLRATLHASSLGVALASRAFHSVHSEFTMKKLPDRFFAEHVVVISGQADGPLIILKWVDGKLVIVKPPPEPEPWFKEVSRMLGVLGPVNTTAARRRSARS